MNKLQKIYYSIFYKDCKFEDSDYYGFFTNGERLHGIILGHNPIVVRDHWHKFHYKCNDCPKMFGEISKKEFDCVNCGNDARTKENRVIFVRAKVDNKWGSHPCCMKCWCERNPNREANTCDVEIFE